MARLDHELAEGLQNLAFLEGVSGRRVVDGPAVKEGRVEVVFRRPRRDQQREARVAFDE